MSWAVKQKVPDPQSKILLLMLANHAGRHETDHDTCWPSMRLLADECCMSEDTVARRLLILERLNLIRVTKRCAQDGRLTSNLYRLFVPDDYYGTVPAAGGYPTRCQRDTPPPAAVETYNINRTNNKGDFHKPSIEQVSTYGTEEMDPPLPQHECIRFWHYYESNGWKVGRNPMKSWQSAMVNWRKNYDNQVTTGGIVKPTGQRSVFELKSIIEAKRQMADSLKNGSSYEVATGRKWRTKEDGVKYYTLVREIEELTKQLAGM